MVLKHARWGPLLALVEVLESERVGYPYTKYIGVKGVKAHGVKFP